MTKRFHPTTLVAALRGAIGPVRWRIQYRYWYELSRRQKSRLSLLSDIVRKHFNHPWVTNVELQLRERAGNEENLGTIHWDAPIAVSVCRTRRRGKRPALCMSLDVRGNIIRIRQLQGYVAIDIPVSLRNWPRRFVEACQELAIEKQVRIPKAHLLASYRDPSIEGAKTEAELEGLREGIRTRMRSHYDATARELGFADRGNWFVWANPCYRSRARSLALKIWNPPNPVLAD